MLKKVAFILFIAVLALLIPASVVAVFRNKTLQQLGPVGNSLITAQNKATNTYNALRQINSLRKQKEDLQKEVVNLHQDLNDLQNTKKENEELRKELGIVNVNPSISKVFAKVIVRGNNPLDKTFTINIGSSQGIKVGQPAVSQGHIIGKVITVNKESATVRSITSRYSRVQAIINESQEKGLVSGDGNILYLSDITQGTSQKEGSLVTTSGLGGSLPSSLLIGTLGTPQSEPSDLSQKFMINPPFDPSLVDSLFILIIETQTSETSL